LQTGRKSIPNYRIAVYLCDKRRLPAGGFFDPAEADRLKENLKAFSPQLPPGVVQSGDYLDKR
jgi:hypothetical protein